MSFNKNLSIKLTKCESILDKITLYESIDNNILNKLINSDLLKIITNPISKKHYLTEKEQLSNYKKLINNNVALVKYNKTDKIGFGRVNPEKSLGLFSFRKAIRHTLAKNTFEDIDIENCHPELLVQICNANNIKCNYLKKYIENREYYLEEVVNKYNVNRDEAKKLFISLMYFGSFTPLHI
jgi:hypothetical protein